MVRFKRKNRRGHFAEHHSSMESFTCNICCARNTLPAQPFQREAPSCASCGSSVRVRGLLHALSKELLGASLALPDFPRVRSLCGLGVSDGPLYSERLREKLDYRNTFYDREPRLDLLNPPAGDIGRYDFVLASEVFEHVPAPVERAFSSASAIAQAQRRAGLHRSVLARSPYRRTFPGHRPIRARAGWRPNGASQSIARWQARCHRQSPLSRRLRRPRARTPRVFRSRPSRHDRGRGIQRVPYLQRRLSRIRHRAGGEVVATHGRAPRARSA